MKLASRTSTLFFHSFNAKFILEQNFHGLASLSDHQFTSTSQGPLIFRPIYTRSVIFLLHQLYFIE